jgi:NAD-dependent deacetylase
MSNAKLWSADEPPQLVILSGAGLSAESGLKTFRDADGLWDGADVKVVCNFENWRRNHQLVHRFYSERRAAAAHVSPNGAHLAIARWQGRWPVHVLTQNIDGLLEAAGCTDVLHLHGRLIDMECHACGHRWEHGLRPWNPVSDRCPACGSQAEVKPGVVFFGEPAPAYARLFAVLESLRKKDVLLVIGTSGYVLPVAQFGYMNPGIGILNNLERSIHIPDAAFDHAFYRPATEAVVDIEEMLQSVMG